MCTVCVMSRIKPQLWCFTDFLRRTLQQHILRAHKRDQALLFSVVVIGYDMGMQSRERGESGVVAGRAASADSHNSATAARGQRLPDVQVRPVQQHAH